LGNYDLKGNVFIDNNSMIHGTLKATGDIFCCKKTTIQGNINSNGDVRIEDKAHIAGDINGNKIYLSRTASVNGELLAKKGISFMEPSKIDAEEKVKRFETDVDVIDEVKDMME
jgi:predicted acyltransferase (DUF342 family)